LNSSSKINLPLEDPDGARYKKDSLFFDLFIKTSAFVFVLKKILLFLKFCMYFLTKNKNSVNEALCH
jgi:hypothetical protein